MSDYCDCRRVPEIAKLERIEDLADEVLALSRVGSHEMPTAVQRPREVLDPHVSWEENGVLSEAREADLGAYYIVEEYDLSPAAVQVLTETQWEAIAV